MESAECPAATAAQDDRSNPYHAAMVDALGACDACGQIQRLPVRQGPARLRCARCSHRLHDGRITTHRLRWALTLALSALLLFPAAITLPLLSVERFGHRSESGALAAALTLLGGGEILIGAVVLLCSVVIPFAKLAMLVVLAAPLLLHRRIRLWMYLAVEWTGRWGMLDVLLVAVVVAVLKLGDLVEVRPGPGAVAFTTMVLLSLVAGAVFDPRSIWRDAGP